MGRDLIYRKIVSWPYSNITLIRYVSSDMETIACHQDGKDIFNGNFNLLRHQLLTYYEPIHE